MQIIAVVNEKGGTGKTTTSVSLSAALGSLGKRILMVDLDGQASASRWFGVEEDDRLADALLAGGGLEPIPNVAPGVSLAPSTGKVDSVARDLRPSQSAQLRKVLRQVQGDYDLIIMDCPPSLNNRLIGNALMAATHVLVPVETSIMALDGLQILLTTLEDIGDAFDHRIVLAGVLACRYDARTRLSRLVLEELRRALPNKVFSTVIRENVRMRECPASGQSILEFAPESHAAEDYLALAQEMLANPEAWQQPAFWEIAHADDIEDEAQRCSVDSLRSRAAETVRAGAAKANQGKTGRSGKPEQASSTDSPGAQPQEPRTFTTPAPSLPSTPVETPQALPAAEVYPPSQVAASEQGAPRPAAVDRWTGGPVPGGVFATPQQPTEVASPPPGEPAQGWRADAHKPAAVDRWTGGSAPSEAFASPKPRADDTSPEANTDSPPNPPHKTREIDSCLDRLAEAKARLSGSEGDIPVEGGSPASQPAQRPQWRTAEPSPAEPSSQGNAPEPRPEDLRLSPAPASSAPADESTGPTHGGQSAWERGSEAADPKAETPKSKFVEASEPAPPAGADAFPALREFLSQISQTREMAGAGSASDADGKDGR